MKKLNVAEVINRINALFSAAWREPEGDLNLGDFGYSIKDCNRQIYPVQYEDGAEFTVVKVKAPGLKPFISVLVYESGYYCLSKAGTPKYDLELGF